MKIAVLLGGLSLERNVSINGGKAVCSALKELDFDVIAVDPALGENGIINIDELVHNESEPTMDELAKFSPKNIIDCINSKIFDDVDVAFLVLHGKYGEDGRIQALLELRGIPYTGSDVKSSAIGIDKLASKMLFEAAGIATPPWILIHPKHIGDFEFYEEIRSELGEKIVIKPNDQGSTIGVTIVEDGNLDDIHNGIIEAAKFSNTILAETFIEGREITVGIIGNQALPIIEIVPEEGFYDYEHKYTKGKTEYICPAELTDDIVEFMQHLAMKSFMVLGCAGFARADFRLTDEGMPYIMEINTIPGFTATSLVPMAAKELGIEFPELCKQIIDLANNVGKSK